MEIRIEDVEKNDVQAVKKAIAAGADVNLKDTLNRSLLMLAASMNSLEVAKLLIEDGAELNEKRSDGTTILMWACSPKMIELLKKHGAG